MNYRRDIVILRQRAIFGMTFEQIAEDHNLCHKTVYNIVGDMLNKIHVFSEKTAVLEDAIQLYKDLRDMPLTANEPAITLDDPINHLSLSSRSIRNLSNNGVKTIGQLCNLKSSCFLMMPILGESL